jgi:hypothetical protein
MTNLKPSGAVCNTFCSELTHKDCVTARAHGHHHDAAPSELIVPLVCLHPREDLGFSHAQIELDTSLLPQPSRNLARRALEKGPDFRHHFLASPDQFRGNLELGVERIIRP